MKSRDIKSLITGITFIVAFILYTTFAPDKEEVEDKQVQNEVEESVAEVQISAEQAEQITGNSLEPVKYLSVNDGDTFSVEWNGEKKRIRLLMIDTPEMNYDKGEPMPFAEEAKEFTSSLLKNAQTVEVLFDKGPKEDDYERLLAYVYIDGKLLQESLLEKGLGAIRYVNKPNNSLESLLRDIQKQAENEKVGIWSIEGYFENNRFQNVTN